MKKGFSSLLALLFLSASADAASVTGRIRFTGRPSAATASVIVYAEPVDGRRVQPGKFTLAQRNKTFLPRVLAVPAGSTVIFPNHDPIFHNVFSLSRPNPFDLGLYRAGEAKERTFAAPATYRVFCNIHPQMSATILVVPTSYITEPDNAGNYRFDLPAGRYRVTAWSERSLQPATTEITVGESPQTVSELIVDESKFVEAQHKNKFGQDYPKSAFDGKKN